uniref:Uncharacterized protein n=1 Tax=Timema poppense TaxID=170557 RepID=A0A7R9D9J6_TIMPO|nr:unnamed protein product [Timema poppensis]
MVVTGLSSAPQTGIIGLVNKVGGALSNSISLRSIEEKIKQLRRFFYTGREVTVHIGAPASDRDALSWLEEQITVLLNRMQDHGVSADDHFGLLLNSMDSTLNPVYISFRRADQSDAQAMLDNISRMLQSNNLFLSKAPLYVKLSHFKEHCRSARYCDKLSPATTYSRRNQGIITTQNGEDTLCLSRVLVIANTVCDFKREPGCMDMNTYKHRKEGRHIQKYKAEDLSRDARVDLLKGGGGITELKQFQQYLSEYKITMFRERWRRQVLYEGPTPPKNSFKGYLD